MSPMQSEDLQPCMCETTQGANKLQWCTRQNSLCGNESHDRHAPSEWYDELCFLINEKKTPDIVPFLWFAKAKSYEFDLCSDYRMLEDVDRSIDNHSRDPLRRSGVNKVVNNVSYECMYIIFIVGACC